MQHDFILLDRSQSMSSRGRWAEAIAGINGYVKKLADDNVDTGITLAVFDKNDGNLCFEVIRNRITPKTWKPVSNEDATPRGWTPLYDAVGQIVSLAHAGFNGTPYDKVAIIIVTDGENNSSKEVSLTQARVLLDGCRGLGWQVIFLGADFDNAAQAASLNNNVNATVSAGIGKLVETMHVTASKRHRYSVTGQSISYSDDEKAGLK